MTSSKKSTFVLLAVFVLLATLPLVWQTVSIAIQRNLLALQTARGLLAGAPLPGVGQFAALAEDCRASWLLGLIQNQNSPNPTLNSYWYRMLQCDPQRVEFLPRPYAGYLDFARQVNIAQPDNAEGWFWVAELIAADQPEEALEYYRHGLALNPDDSRRWTYVGDLLTQAEDLPGALEAYLMACQTGDAGYNGCMRAGSTAEKMGDYQAAIRYYRMSYWPRSWEQAEKLEKQLQVQP